MNIVNVGLRIKKRRKELKMSAEELGERLGKDRSTIYRYEKGEIENLPIELLKPIAEALDTTPEQLIGWEVIDPLAKIAERATFDAKLTKNKELLHMIQKFIALPDDKKKTIKQMIDDYYDAFA